MKFLENNERFLGTGGRNAQGQTLDEFLDAYDAKKYDCPSNTVDMMVLAACAEKYDVQGGLRLLLIRRSNFPCIGYWALPGGFVDIRENLEDAAARELLEETGVADMPLIQLGTYGDYDRDPRWRVITTAFLTLLDQQPAAKAGDDAADALWMDVSLESRQEEGRTLHELTLSCPERGITCRALTEERVLTRGLLKERRRKLLSSEMLCTDHGLIITEGLLWLREEEKR